MKTLTAALLATAFIASPALACSFGKSASHEKPMVTASKSVKKSHEAMSTFDPAGRPVFEDKAEVKEETAETVKKPVSE